MKGRNRRIRHLTMIVLIFCAPIACGFAQSHIDANVPRNDDFDNFLKRDLAKYFSANNGQVTGVEYELLRDGPTQTGISYPKFYAWVRIVRNAGDKEEGAVRLAAIDRVRFEITHFLNKDRIVSDPSLIESVFPIPVCDKIREKLK